MNNSRDKPLLGLIFALASLGNLGCTERRESCSGLNPISERSAVERAYSRSGLKLSRDSALAKDFSDTGCKKYCSVKIQRYPAVYIVLFGPDIIDNYVVTLFDKEPNGTIIVRSIASVSSCGRVRVNL